MEIQAGLFENQETFGDLEPGHSREFREYWLPVRGLSGITRASRDAVMYLAKEGGAVKLELLATRPMSKARLRIGETVETVALDPAKVWTRTIAGSVLPRMELEDAARKVVVTATGLERDFVKEAAVARWAGDGAKAAAAVARAEALDPTDPLARFERVRQGASDPELWTHLAADPERVIEVADAYMQWGLYRDADVVLSYRYAPVPANWTEPGAVLPLNYALVAYYRGTFIRSWTGMPRRISGRLPACL